MARVLKAIGPMSGTSIDGIDAAILDTDDEAIAAFGPTHFEPYGDEMRAKLRPAMARTASLPAAGPLPADLADGERELTQAGAATSSKRKLSPISPCGRCAACRSVSLRQPACRAG